MKQPFDHTAHLPIYPTETCGESWRVSLDKWLVQPQRPHSLTFAPVGNWISPINLTCMCLDGGRKLREPWGNPGEHSPDLESTGPSGHEGTEQTTAPPCPPSQGTLTGTSFKATYRWHNVQALRKITTIVQWGDIYAATIFCLDFTCGDMLMTGLRGQHHSTTKSIISVQYLRWQTYIERVDGDCNTVIGTF